MNRKHWRQHEKQKERVIVIDSFDYAIEEMQKNETQDDEAIPPEETDEEVIGTVQNITRLEE